MSERSVEESSQSGVGLAGGVDQSLEERRNESLDLRVVDDLSELLETGVGGLTDLSAVKIERKYVEGQRENEKEGCGEGEDALRIRKNGGQLRNDGGKRKSELSRSTESHGSEELDRSLFGSPLLLLETFEKRREDDVDAVTG